MPKNTIIPSPVILFSSHSDFNGVQNMVGDKNWSIVGLGLTLPIFSSIIVRGS